MKRRRSGGVLVEQRALREQHGQHERAQCDLLVARRTASLDDRGERRRPFRP